MHQGTKAKEILAAEESYERSLHKRALELVERHWSKVETIAEVLLREKTLEPGAIIEILRKVT